MKKIILLISLQVIVILTTVGFSSCNKKTDPIPDYPQLIGHWSGTTSQGTQVRFMIDNLKGFLFVTEYHLIVYTSAGYHEYLAYYSYGLGGVVNKQFKIHISTGSAGESYIDGTFNTNDMTLYGNFAVYDPANATDLITGTYSCSMGTNK